MSDIRNKPQNTLSQGSSKNIKIVPDTRGKEYIERAKPKKNTSSQGSSKNIKIVTDDSGKQYIERTKNVIKPREEFTNDTANVVNSITNRVKALVSRIVPVTSSSYDAVSLHSIVPIFESKDARRSKSDRKGGKSRRKRTLKKRGGTRNSRQ